MTDLGIRTSEQCVSCGRAQGDARHRVQAMVEYHQFVPLRYNARRHIWLKAGDPLICPSGHKLKHNAALLQHEAFICQHQEGKQASCNLRCYVLAMPDGLRFVAEVTTDEMLTMRNRRMGVPEVLDFLCGRAAA